MAIITSISQISYCSLEITLDSNHMPQTLKSFRPKPTIVSNNRVPSFGTFTVAYYWPASRGVVRPFLMGHVPQYKSAVPSKIKSLSLDFYYYAHTLVRYIINKVDKKRSKLLQCYFCLPYQLAIVKHFLFLFEYV